LGERTDGSLVVAKVVGIAFGATPNDIPWLRLEVADGRGSGILSGVATAGRISTRRVAHFATKGVQMFLHVELLPLRMTIC
jgi:hypothetical protein